MLITILLAQNIWVLCALRRKHKIYKDWDEGQWQVFELTEKKRECDRIRKRELHKTKKTGNSFEGFNDSFSISMADETSAPHKEPTPGPSIPPVSMSCDTKLKPLSELWTHYGFTGPIVTEALLCLIVGDSVFQSPFPVTIHILNLKW